MSLTMRLSQVFTFSAFLVLMGCTTVCRVTRDNPQPKLNKITPEEFFERVGSDHLDVKLATGHERYATILPLRGDSISLVSQEDSLALPIHQIQSASKKHYLLGVVVYPPLGMLVGALLGGALGQASSGDDAWGGYASFIAGMAIGSVCGLTLGIINPPMTVYEFSDREQLH